MENIIASGSRIGTKPNDIKNIYTHVTENNEFDYFYVIYNNGKIDKINKPIKTSQSEFLPEFKKFLLQVGATDLSRDKIWYLISDNDKNIEKITETEQAFQEQKKAEMENTRRIYRAKKVKVVDKVLRDKDLDVKPLVANALSTAVFALSFLSSTVNHHTFAQKITGLATAVGVVMFSISMSRLRKIIRKAWDEVAGIETEQESAIGIEAKDENLIEENSQNSIEDKHAKR